MRGHEYCHSQLKRNLDCAIASGSLATTSPLWLIMRLYNKSRGEPTFFRQERMGQNQQSFMVIKFETLYYGAENDQWHHTSYHTSSRNKDKLDPRIQNNAMGFMRQTGLNELPQLINVLRGEMSVVGPRPMHMDYIQEAEDIFPEITKEWRKAALTIKPGIVGVSPLETRRIPVEEFDKKAEADILYLEEATFWKDLQIIAQAAVSMTR